MSITLLPARNILSRRNGTIQARRRFSTDGKYLIFTSDRDFRPIYSWIEWNFAYTDRSGVYMTMLAAGTRFSAAPDRQRVRRGFRRF